MNYFLLLLVSVFSLNVAAQKDSLVLVKTVPIKATYFTTDPVGNSYVVRNENFIIKYNSNGDSIGIYNDIKRGRITQIDASNPLRVLIFYGQYGQITILDNMLSPKNMLDLKRIGLFNVPCIANSADGNIWVYDPVGQLVKIDEGLHIRFSSPLRNLLGESIDPCYMLEYDRELYLVDSIKGISRFDRFAFYLTTYPFQASEIQLYNDYIIYSQEATLVSYHRKSLEEQKMWIPNDDGIKQVRWGTDRIHVLRKNSLDIYRTMASE